ncbi:hypothetical protein [Rhizobium leguminosarum]|uniref:hypothetical protein n=1 Tax=Rhizobium leguminosarum TaxID=384 RepID=UPI001C9717C2|nr:hypothetical protein [Rhizobium leguminosarum]MBY5406149.1 hypothetical protein [Rhizobium leguminosarum]
MLAASSRVARVNSQPHSLFVGVRGIKRQLRYTPDIEAYVHSSFLEELLSGRPLFEIVADPFNRSFTLDEALRVVFEMKATQDKSLDDPSAETKMRIVKAIYAHVGQPFLVLSERPHINTDFLTIITDLEAGARDNVGALERSRALFAFGRERCMAFGPLSEVLGGQPSGERLVKALHFKQFLSIDLRRGLFRDTPVWLTREAEFGRDV